MFVLEPLGLILLVLVIAAGFLRTLWVTAIVVTLLVAVAVLSIIAWAEPDEIIKDALSEGCVAIPVLRPIALLAVGGTLAAATWRSARG